MEQTSNWKPLEENSWIQNLETKFGLMTLEKLGQSDRGSHRFTTMPTPGAHNKFLDLIPLYFFGEEVAKAEIVRWLKTIEELCLIERKLSIDWRAEYLLHGKHCMITRGKFYLDGNFCGYYFNVITAKELEFVLTVDASDVIPRLFVDEDAACSNAEAWIKARNQKPDSSTWEQI